MDNIFEKKTNSKKKMKLFFFALPFVLYIVATVAALTLSNADEGMHYLAFITEHGEAFFSMLVASMCAIILASFYSVFGLNHKKSPLGDDNWFIEHFENKLDSIWAKTAIIPALIIVGMWVAGMMATLDVIPVISPDMALNEKFGALLRPAFTPILVACFVYLAVACATANDVTKDEMRRVGLFADMELLRNHPRAVGVFNAVTLALMWVFAIGVACQGAIDISFDPSNWFNGKLLFVLLMGSITAIISVHDVYFRTTVLTMGLVVISSKLNLSWWLSKLGGETLYTDGGWFGSTELFYMNMGHMLSYTLLFGCLMWIAKGAFRKKEMPLFSVWQFLLATVVIALQYNVSASSIRYWEQTPHIEQDGQSSYVMETKEIDEVAFNLSKFRFERLYQSNYAKEIKLDQYDMREEISKYLNDLGYKVNAEEINRVSMWGFGSLTHYKRALHSDISYSRGTSLNDRTRTNGEESGYQAVSSHFIDVIGYEIAYAEAKTFLAAIPIVDDALKALPPVGKFGEGFNNAHERGAKMVSALRNGDKKHFWALYFEDTRMIEEVTSLQKLAYRVSLIDEWAPTLEEGQSVITPKSVELKNKMNVTVGDVEVPKPVFDRALAEINTRRLIKFAPKLQKVVQEDAAKRKSCGLMPHNC